ncbi:maleylpyruvate isomerase N-terminal domain-containing protein [Streptomyces avicenniae]|uniref:maleylpyruvate isomerase N-terminal domain-containing protein n=1 Tax=Streptomyces avicenniae TaxID=500153 RepID=UPI00069BA724|nr:maleylpyruvate isomerase N-terminal domain-containing protein [Streptomyces avicenniae]
MTTATPTPTPTPTATATSWTGLLAATADTCLAALRQQAHQNWSRPAHGLDWSRSQTLDHLAFGLVGYAGLLIARPTDRYVTLLASLDPHAPVPDRLDGLRIAAHLLTTTVRDTPPDARAWHPWGHSDATGFAAMGITELAVHTHDITRTLDPAWSPPDTPAAAAVHRLFPEAPPGHAPADTLLWCTGRAALPGLPRRTAWQWDGTTRDHP